MTPPDPETAARARMPADVDAPDKVLYGLTFRQLAILAVAAVVFAAGWHLLHPLVPPAVLVVVAVPLGGVVFAIAVGRRDGLPFDVWLTHAIRYQRAPHALSTTDTSTGLPPWVTPPTGRVPLPAPLRLPAAGDRRRRHHHPHQHHHERGCEIGPRSSRPPPSTSPCAHPPNRPRCWTRSAGGSTHSPTPPRSSSPTNPSTCNPPPTPSPPAPPQLPNPALAAACADHAAFLTQLAHRRDPLRRQVLITTRSQRTRPAHRPPPRRAHRPHPGRTRPERPHPRRTRRHHRTRRLRRPLPHPTPRRPSPTPRPPSPGTCGERPSRTSPGGIHDHHPPSTHATLQRCAAH